MSASQRTVDDDDAMDIDSPRVTHNTTGAVVGTSAYGAAREVAPAIRERLEMFRQKMDEKRPESHKFDMLALRDFRAQRLDFPSEVGKHPWGVPVGAEFNYRVELVVCGVHGRVMGGIDHEKDSVCRAVVLSGKYTGDVDDGKTFIYSGEGGGSTENRRDQEWTAGNQALLQSLKQKTPVRVIRGIPNLYPDALANAAKHYVYDGLYRVVGAWTDTSGRYKECRFQLQGIPGEYRVSGTVQVGDLYQGHRNKMAVSSQRLAAGRRQQQRAHTYGHRSQPRDMITLEYERREFLEKRGNVLCMDLAGMKEAVRIPLINDSNNAVSMPQFKYITSLYHTTDEAQHLIDASRSHFVYSGCQKRNGSNYDETGCLIVTQPEGIKECPQSCATCQNSIVSMRVRYPLEVFLTEDKGWGVRCAVDIPQGAFVCEYAGKVLTDREVEQHIDATDSTYLFSLDHFYLMKRSALLGNEKINDQKMPPLPLSDEDIKNEHFHGHFLVIDAKDYGNVGRFLNHACRNSANLVAQMVLLPNCNGIIHHVGFFALKDIPRYTELCHDYGWIKGSGNNLRCNCNDPECTGLFPN